MIVYRGMDLTAAPDLAQQFLASAQNSLATGEPLLLAGYTLCTLDPDAEFFGDIKMAIEAASFVPVGENEVLLNCDMGVVVRDMRQGPAGWEIMAQEAQPVQEAPPEEAVPEPGQKNLRKKQKMNEGDRVRVTPTSDTLEAWRHPSESHMTVAELAAREQYEGTYRGKQGRRVLVSLGEGEWFHALNPSNFDVEPIPPEKSLRKRGKAHFHTYHNTQRHYPNSTTRTDAEGYEYRQPVYEGSYLESEDPRVVQEIITDRNDPNRIVSSVITDEGEDADDYAQQMADEGEGPPYFYDEVNDPQSREIEEMMSDFGGKKPEKRLKSVPPIGSRVRARPNANEVGNIQDYEYRRVTDPNGVSRPSTASDILNQEERVGELLSHNGSIYVVRHPEDAAEETETYFVADSTDLSQMPPEKKRLKALRRKWLGKGRTPQIGEMVHLNSDMPYRPSRATATVIRSHPNNELVTVRYQDGGTVREEEYFKDELKDATGTAFAERPDETIDLSDPVDD